LGISVFSTPLDGALQEAEYRRVFAAMSQDGLDALIVSPAEENFTNRRVIVELAEKARLPAIYAWPEYIEMGGLMAYAADRVRSTATPRGKSTRSSKVPNRRRFPSTK
jgi:putative ABC transport system substrate-binding protein